MLEKLVAQGEGGGGSKAQRAHWHWLSVGWCMQAPRKASTRMRASAERQRARAAQPRFIKRSPTVYTDAMVGQQWPCDDMFTQHPMINKQFHGSCSPKSLLCPHPWVHGRRDLILSAWIFVRPSSSCKSCSESWAKRAPSTALLTKLSFLCPSPSSSK